MAWSLEDELRGCSHSGPCGLATNQGPRKMTCGAQPLCLGTADAEAWQSTPNTQVVPFLHVVFPRLHVRRGPSPEASLARSHRGEGGTPAKASARWRNALCPTLSRPVPVYLAIPETCAPLNSQTNHVTIFRTAQMTRYPTYDVVATEVGLPADARAPTSVATAPCRTRRVRTRSSAEHFSGRGRRGAPNQRLLWLGN